MTAFERAIRGVSRRQRTQRALDAAGLAGLAAIAVAAPLLAALKTGHLELEHARNALSICLALPLAAAAIASLRAVSRLWAAQRLDRSHDLKGLCASAWELSSIPTPARSSFERACLAQAAGLGRLSPKTALPLRVPRGLGGLLLATAGVCLLGLLEVRASQAVAPPPPAKPVLLEQDDLDAASDALADLQTRSELDASLKPSVDALNRLLEGLAARELDRGEALEQLRELEQALRDAAAGDREQLEAAMRELSRRLGHRPITESLAKALAQSDAARAAEAAQELAEQVEGQKLDKRQQAQLSSALKRARDKGADAREQALEARRRELERLLKRQREETNAPSPQQKRLLKRKQRELERLRREHEEHRALQRQLDRLSRELNQAAQQLGAGQQQQAGQHMRNGAQELSRMHKQQLTQQQRQQLARQLSQLREMLRSAGQRMGMRPGTGKGGGQQGRGQNQPLTLGRFAQLAQGGKQGKGGQDNTGRAGRSGEGGDKDGDKSKGNKQGPKALALSQDGKGEGLLMLPGQQGLSLQQPGGSQAGDGGRPQQGKQTDGKGKHVDSQQRGQQGQGPTRSEVILEAASRGFANRGYRKVAREYRKHAESVLSHDEIPGGYRFYVRRYFQLIRPREVTP